MEEFSWSDDRSEIDIPGFSKAVGPNTIIPVGALALDFFLLFMSNRNVERHFPEYLPTNESVKRKERRCKVCFGVRKVTSYFCLVSVLRHISAPFINNLGKTPKFLTLNHSYIVLS